MLIKYVRSVNSQTISGKDDFGKASHSLASEPFYYDTGYRHLLDSSNLVVDRPNRCLDSIKPKLTENEFTFDKPIVMDEAGRAHLSEVLLTSNEDKPKRWACSVACRQVSDEDVDTIMSIKTLFQKSLAEIRESLQNIDKGCPHGHHVKPNEMNDDMVDTEHTKLGHPLACAAEMCHSKLRVLRAASVHYPALRNMLFNVYHARKCHSTIDTIDGALQNTNPLVLLQFLSITQYEELVDDDDDGTDLPLSEESIQGIGEAFIVKGLPHLETHLEVTHASMIKQYNNKLDDDPCHPCCSCERLFLRSNVSEFNFGTEKYNSPMWNRLKQHLLEIDPDIRDIILYICNHCRPILNNNQMPNWCILNGLITEPVPDELAKLNVLERQLIQRAKAFQMIVRLGTYTGKVPIYNALKAVKGSMFVLPLPMEKTLNDLTLSVDPVSSLPDPELYILVNGRPTKDKVVWQTLVDVGNVKQAVQKLKEINVFYRDISDSAVDDAAKKTIEVVSNVSSTLLEKSTKEDIDGLQAFTIRRMNEKLPVGLDCDQYKMLTIQEHPLDIRQCHLDVLCFPSLLPTGRFGQHYHRDIKLSFSEYVKSRLLNKDARFRKNPEFVFYNLWVKEM